MKYRYLSRVIYNRKSIKKSYVDSIFHLLRVVSVGVTISMQNFNNFTNKNLSIKQMTS